MSFSNDLLIKKIKSGDYTDEDRKKLMGNHACDLGGEFDLDALGEELMKRGTNAQKSSFQEASNYYDGIRPFLTASKSGKEEDMPLVFDLRRKQTEVCICYVNGGANDFNSANTKTGLCPSIMVATQFSTNPDHYRVEYAPEKKTRIQNANDLLYIYRTLRDNPKGLNHKMIEAYDKKHPEAKIAETLGKMDALLQVSEAERFVSQSVKSEKPKKKVGFWKRLAGGR